MNEITLLSAEIRYEEDVIGLRQRARQIARLLGFSDTEQTGFATAVTEVARNAVRYAGSGRAAFTVAPDRTPPLLGVRISDAGPGIADPHAALGGTFVPDAAATGLGLAAAQRLCDVFELDTAVGRGTSVTLGKYLPRRAPAVIPEVLATLSAELARRGPRSSFEEVQQQNRELLHALALLRVRQAEIERLNAELAETNRGVVALYAELEDRAESLRRASDYKSRFLSDMTHELRTPLNAVISLSRLLLERADGELTPEQDKQVGLINRSATSLGEMVNDLLDMAKIEAGKVDVHATEFDAADVLAALRGMFRPLQVAGSVPLVVEEPLGLPPLRTDERRLAQVLRNLVSNALKFTERGEVRVTAEAADDGHVAFRVADTGIGIAPYDLERIFDDFTQIDSPLQRQVRGTGLGLPLARKLAGLLGGEISVHSAVGVGTTFLVTLPAELPATGPDTPLTPDRRP